MCRWWSSLGTWTNTLLWNWSKVYFFKKQTLFYSRRALFYWTNLNSLNRLNNKYLLFLESQCFMKLKIISSSPFFRYNNILKIIDTNFLFYSLYSKTVAENQCRMLVFGEEFIFSLDRVRFLTFIVKLCRIWIEKKE